MRLLLAGPKSIHSAKCRALSVHSAPTMPSTKWTLRTKAMQTTISYADLAGAGRWMSSKLIAN
eukprot:1698857-Alexandrium_andersonii.AAC.1